MADALCGPSNALQSFRKHTQVDRTLQQDRLTGPRHSPAQGFRSHDPRTGSLEADFNAFENARPDPSQFNQSTFFQAQVNSQPPPATTNWAAEFQKLHVSPQPIPVQQFRHEAPLIRSTTGGWHNEFFKQRQNMTPVAQGKQAEHQTNNYSGSNNMQMGYNTQNYLPQSQVDFQPVVGLSEAQLQKSHVQQENQFQDVDFDKAFQEVFDQVEQTDQVLDTHQALQESSVDADQSFNAEATIHDSSNIRIGSDAIQYISREDRAADQEAQDSGALARVAGQLIQNVQHDTSDKFQNSNFMELMRRIRDREIEVRNNDFEATQNDTATNSATLYNNPQMEESLKHHDPNSFAFPDMNQVYEPDHVIDATDYSFDADQYPSSTQSINQISDLHPGGKFYPEQSPPASRHAQMSGAVNITADDFDRNEESGSLASKYQPSA